MSTTTTDPTTIAEDILWRILGEITLHKDDIRISSEQLGRGSMINIRVSRSDMPRVLGTKGANIKVLGKLVGAIGAKRGLNLRITVSEPVTGNPERHGRFEPKESWNSSGALLLAADICENVFRHPVKLDLHDAPNYTSLIEVIVSPQEQRETVAAVKEALGVIFASIGYKNGRLLAVDILTVEQHAAT